MVDKVSVHDLNIAKENLEDILILHLEGGKDVFLTVSGTFLPTSFGQSLEALVKLAHPVRSVPVGQLIDLVNLIEAKFLWQFSRHEIVRNYQFLGFSD